MTDLLNKKYLAFYEQCMEAGRIPKEGFDSIWGGMCAISLFKTDEFKLFIPQTFDELGPYQANNKPHGGYWGYDGYETNEADMYQRAFTFSPLRQNIVLFLAAMNNEL
jgi:hypothetical protein